MPKVNTPKAETGKVVRAVMKVSDVSTLLNAAGSARLARREGAPKLVGDGGAAKALG
jgi:hypothetical protein